MPTNASYKWVPNDDGPFKIIAKVDQLKYRVQDLKKEKRKFVVHVQRLIKWRETERIQAVNYGENKIGYKLMKLSGWQFGKGLGKKSDGITEPVCLNSNNNRFGISFSLPDV